jgi:predicted transcriptional regulator
MTTVQVAIRLPADQAERVERVAKGMHSTRSEVIRRALELYLYRLDCERDAHVYSREPLTAAELALADDPDGWKDTPAW